jgi:predicted enzyme related to lactoylglutathione lyase
MTVRRRASGGSRQPGSGAACLRVGDVEAAATYYRHVLAFELVSLLGGAQPQFAVMRKHGALLLLQQDAASAGRQPSPDRHGPPWDAILLVDDVPAAHHDLQAKGAEALGDIDGKGIGWDSFDFQDCCGNVICVGQTADAFFELMSGTPGGRLAQGLAQWRLRQARRAADRDEQRQLRRFRDFYRGLPDKENIFYMFFTADLLHWVAKAESFVPPEANLVLIGSALHDDEQKWITDHIDRPFHHISIPVDDVTAWEFIFAVSEHNFGWLDIDCFVLDGKIFDELATLGDDVSMNCVWSWETPYGFRIANTHLLFLSAAAIKAVESRQVSASPSVYDWRGSQRRFAQRACFARIPDEKQRALMLEVLPADLEGRPRLLEGDYYNTLVVYQLLARAIGYRVHQTRELARRCRAPFDAESTDPEHWPEDMSDELFHLFGISYYRTHDYEPGIRGLYLAAEYVMLDAAAAILPDRYARLKEKIAAELAAAGQAVETARDRMRRHLIDSRKVSPAAADRILTAPVGAQSKERANGRSG